MRGVVAWLPLGVDVGEGLIGADDTRVIGVNESPARREFPRIRHKVTSTQQVRVA